MRLLGDDLWQAIHAVHRDRGKKWVAVPYVSPGAVARFPLRRNDVLVLRFDDQTIRNSGTDPKEVIQYLSRDVRVYNRNDLHAKVYVSNRRAVVGSANLSGRSEERLKEAGVASTDRRFIRQAREFVHSLRGQPISLEWARSKTGLYVPPRGTGERRGVEVGQAMWAISFGFGDRSDQAKEAAAEAVKSAKRKLRRPDRFQLLVLQTYKQIPIKEGDWVFQYCQDGRERYFEAPARVLAIKRYRESRGENQVIVVQERKRLRARSAGEFITKLRKTGIRLRRPSRFYRVTNAKLKEALFGEWPE
jgi:hypothetical protein